MVRKKVENEDDICKKRIQWCAKKVENEDNICKKNTVVLIKKGKTKTTFVKNVVVQRKK